MAFNRFTFPITTGFEQSQKVKTFFKKKRSPETMKRIGNLLSVFVWSCVSAAIVLRPFTRITDNGYSFFAGSILSSTDTQPDIITFFLSLILWLNLSPILLNKKEENFVLFSPLYIFYIVFLNFFFETFVKKNLLFFSWSLLYRDGWWKLMLFFISGPFLPRHFTLAAPWYFSLSVTSATIRANFLQ